MLSCNRATHSKNETKQKNNWIVSTADVSRVQPSGSLFLAAFFFFLEPSEAQPHLPITSGTAVTEKTKKQTFGWCRAEQTDVTAEAETADLHTRYLTFHILVFCGVNV